MDKPGHRVTVTVTVTGDGDGDGMQNMKRAGWQALYDAINDHSLGSVRLVLADETLTSACALLLNALRDYKQLGGSIERVMTDTARRTNRGVSRGCCVASVSNTSGPGHSRHAQTARPSASSRRCCAIWAYAYVYPSSNHLAAKLEPWMHHYNWHCSHLAVAHRPCATRLGFDGNRVLRNYSSGIADFASARTLPSPSRSHPFGFLRHQLVFESLLFNLVHRLGSLTHRDFQRLELKPPRIEHHALRHRMLQRRR